MEVPGVAGVHVMVVANEDRIPGILQQAGCTPRTDGAVAAAGTVAAAQTAAAGGPADS